MIINFYELRVWQKANNLALQIYKVTKKFPSDEKFNLTSQLRRASTSVGANIAEGFGKNTKNDKLRFFHQARGSLYETLNFILFCKDLKLIKDEEVEQLIEEYKGLIRGLNSFISSFSESTAR